MAWLYKQKGSDNWWIGYRHNGKQVLKSTKTADRAAAEKELSRVEMMFEAHKTGSLTEDLYRALTGSQLPQITLAAELDDWLSEAKHSTGDSTYVKYKGIADEFKSFMNATEQGPRLSEITTSDVSKFLIQKRGQTAASTTNVTRKILAGVFKRAVANNRLRENPVTPIKRFKAQKGEKVKKRSFTLAEVKTIYDKAPDEFWRYMIVGEFYTGLRMGDLICLKWGSVDLAASVIKIEPDKTDDKVVIIPLAKPFHDILAAIKAKAGTVKPSDYIWPEQAQKQQTYKSKSGYFSNQFYSLILEPCGLVPKRNTAHKKEKAGRGSKRQTNEVSFHCLRHSFITNLKATGAGQAVAKALAGHSSDAVNDLYTHIPEDVLAKSINQLPEFVK